MISAMILARENRIMIKDIQKNIGEIKTCMQKLTNHYSRRLPLWATILFTILGSIVVGFIVGGVK